MLFGLPDDHPAIKHIRVLEEIERAARAYMELDDNAPPVTQLAAMLELHVALRPGEYERVEQTKRWRKKSPASPDCS